LILVIFVIIASTTTRWLITITSFIGD